MPPRQAFWTFENTSKKILNKFKKVSSGNYIK